MGVRNDRAEEEVEREMGDGFEDMGGVGGEWDGDVEQNGDVSSFNGKKKGSGDEKCNEIVSFIRSGGGCVQRLSTPWNGS